MKWSKIAASLLALCLAVTLSPAALAEEEQIPYSTDAASYEDVGWGYVKPPEGPYWKYLTLEEGARLLATAEAPGNPSFFIVYTNNPGSGENDYSSVFTMAQAAQNRKQLVYCVDLNEWGRYACAYDTGLANYLPNGAATPVFFWYGGDPRNIIVVDAWILDQGGVVLDDEELVATILTFADKGIGFRSTVSDPMSVQDLDKKAETLPANRPVPSASTQELSKTAPAGESPSPWAAAAVTAARDAWILPKALDGNYTDPITRREFCALVCAYADAVGLASSGKTVSFPDCDDPLVLRAAALGIINGYSDGTFGPNRAVRRDEAAVMLMRLAKCSDLKPNLPSGVRFSDVPGGWAEEGTSFTSACLDPETGATLMGGTSGDQFSPAGSYTREQAIVTFSRLLNVCTLQDVVLWDAAQPLVITSGVTASVQANILSVTGGVHPAMEGTWWDDSSSTLALARLSAGIHPVQLWTAAGDSDTSRGTLTLIKTAAGAYYFQSSPVYAENQAWYDTLTAPTGTEYLEGSTYITTDDSKISSLASQLTAGLSSDYEKLRAITDWISTNITYDWDLYKSGNQTYDSISASGTFLRRSSVCEGYANLTAAMLRAVGIPTRKVSGYALGYGTEERWDDTALSGDSNHAWNLAWADGRWVTVDTTWAIFDPSVWIFSEDHLWLDEDDEAYDPDQYAESGW